MKDLFFFFGAFALILLVVAIIFRKPKSGNGEIKDYRHAHVDPPPYKVGKDNF